MPLSNLIKKDVITATPDQSVLEVADLMKEHDVGAILIAESDGKPLGMITDRDIVLRCVCGGGDCSETKASDIMSPSVDTVSMDSGIMDIIECMKENEIRRVPVVDQSGRAVAVVSFGDVFELLAREISDLSAPATPEEKKIDKQAA